MSATPAQIADLAAAIAGQAEAIANGTIVGPIDAAARRILANAQTLAEWVK